MHIRPNVIIQSLVQQIVRLLIGWFTINTCKRKKIKLELVAFVSPTEIHVLSSILVSFGVSNDGLDRFAETLTKSSVQLTVDDSVMPRFTVANGEALTEQSNDDSSHSSLWSGNNPIRLLIKFIKSIFGLFLRLFDR